MQIREEIDQLIEKAKEEARQEGRHYHLTSKRVDCGAPGCWGRHPLLELAAELRAGARRAGKEVKHRHVWIRLAEDRDECEICGQITLLRIA